jgi:hypothetical protein
MSRIRVVAVVGAAIALTLLVVNWSALGGSYKLSVPSGLTTVMSPEQVVARVTDILNSDAAIAAAAGQPVKPTVIDMITAVRGSEINSVEPRAANVALAPNVTDATVFWVIRAHGTFVTQRGRTLVPRLFDSGYIVLDDVTGQMLARGMP